MRMLSASSQALVFSFFRNSRVRDGKSATSMPFELFQWIAYVAIIFIAWAPVWGQSATTISGTVKDPTGATVAGAIITLVDGKTSSKRQVPTGEAGEYVFSGL